LKDDGIGSDARPISQYDPTDYFRSRTNKQVITKYGHAATIVTDNHATFDAYIVSSAHGGIDHDADWMNQYQTWAELRVHSYYAPINPLIDPMW
jgi:hypothetical protein